MGDGCHRQLCAHARARTHAHNHTHTATQTTPTRTHEHAHQTHTHMHRHTRAHTNTYTHTQSPTYATVCNARSVARRNCVHVYSTICEYTRKFSFNPNSSSLEPDRPQHDRPTALVIAQQYFSAIVSLRYHSHKKSFGLFQIWYYFSFFFFNL